MDLTRAKLAAMPAVDQAAISARVAWLQVARDKQLTPTGDWTTWLLRAGRGFGKTLVGAQDSWWYGYCNAGVRQSIIAPTLGDCRDICIEGVSGFMNVCPSELIKSYKSSLMEIELKNGTMYKGFGTEEPERFRGPQFHRAWGDELGAWKNQRTAYEMMRFGLRLGAHPQFVATTTPRPTPIMVELSKSKTTHLTTGTTYENKANLAASFFDELVKYEGTEIGRQEIMGELIDPSESGIFKRSWIRLWPARRPFPEFLQIIQSYDTAFTEKTSGDPTACTVWGVFQPPERPTSVMLLDAWQEHLAYPDLRTRAQADYWEARYGTTNARKADMVLIEDKGSGISLRQDMIRARIPVIQYNPGKADKVQRAHSVSYLPKAGLVYIPESPNRPRQPRDWSNQFIEDLTMFPFGDNDHYVDSFSQMMSIVRDQGWLTIGKDSEVDPEERMAAMEMPPEYEYSNPYLA